MHFVKLAKVSAAVGAMVAAVPAMGANWLMLQGAEPAASAERARIWGFIQPEYQKTGGGELDAGPFRGRDAVFNQIGPDLDSDSQFNIRRARIGVRGTGFPLDSNVNYFFLLEAGNNGITRNGNGSVKVTDASITLSHIPHARVRIGQFKYPGAEEGLQAIHVFDYINFTNVTNQLLLERFFDEDGSRPGFKNSPNGSVGAFRDVGVQVFDTFKLSQIPEWEHSYALMYGNGNGIARGDNNNDKDWYAYWSSEWVFGGKGPRREGWKTFAWYHDGERTLKTDWDGASLDKDDFDRERWGVGTTFRKTKYRLAAEYVEADGMIFNGSDGGAVPGAIATAGPGAGTAVASWNIEENGEADGWYVHLGYAPHPKWELDLRYDYLDRMSDDDNLEREFETWTLGVQYFFNKKTRMLVNYEFRDAEAPHNDNADDVVDAIDNRASVQFLAVF